MVQQLSTNTGSAWNIPLCIQYLAQEANCYWLLDAIASHQTKQFLLNPKLREFQIWHLQVQDNSGVKSAVGSLSTAELHVLICEWDTNQEVLRQEIEYTDFPLSHIKLYLVEKVLMLNNEY